MQLSFDNVQLGIIAVALLVLAVIALWERIARVVNWVRETITRIGTQFRNAIKLLLDFVASLIFVAMVLTGTICLRELMIVKAIPVDAAFAVLLLFSAAALSWSVVLILKPPPKAGRRKFKVPEIISILAAIASVGFILIPNIRPLLDWFQHEMIAWRLLATVGGDDATVRQAWDEANTVIALLFGVLSGGTAAVTTAGSVTEKLGGLSDDRELSQWQRTVAKKLRDPGASLIKEPLTAPSQYPLELRIENGSPSRLFPFDTDGKQRARVKLIMNEGVAIPHYFDFSTVKELLVSAHVELETALFIVVSHSTLEKRDAEIVSYGIGRELASFTGDEAREFFSGLNTGRSNDVRSAVRKARTRLLRGKPEERVLLCDVAHRGSDELANILDVMKREGLDRIMLTSSSSPLEQGVIGGTEIAAYLSPNP